MRILRQKMYARRPHNIMKSAVKSSEELLNTYLAGGGSKEITTPLSNNVVEKFDNALNKFSKLEKKDPVIRENLKEIFDTSSKGQGRGITGMIRRLKVEKAVNNINKRQYKLRKKAGLGEADLEKIGEFHSRFAGNSPMNESINAVYNSHSVPESIKTRAEKRMKEILPKDTLIFEDAVPGALPTEGGSRAIVFNKNNPSQFPTGYSPENPDWYKEMHVAKSDYGKLEPAHESWHLASPEGKGMNSFRLPSGDLSTREIVATNNAKEMLIDTAKESYKAGDITKDEYEAYVKYIKESAKAQKDGYRAFDSASIIGAGGAGSINIEHVPLREQKKMELQRNGVNLGHGSGKRGKSKNSKLFYN